MKLYVGNLPWSIDEKGLKELFGSYDVEEATLIKDRYSGRSKGFGFVTIADDEAAKKAVSEMHEKEIEGRALTVSEARPMVSRDDAPRYGGDKREESPAEESTNDDVEPEVEDDNSDAEEGEEDIETAEEAMEDAESDEPAAENAPEAEESTESEEPESEKPE
jgi:cold-inducible RNA-binding protein